MSFNPPPLPPTQPPWPQFQVWWQLVLASLQESFTQLFEAVSSMPDIQDVHIVADYTGTVQPGQLPRIVTAQRFTSTTDDTANATWSFSSANGAVTGTIVAGVLTITDVQATDVVTISSDYNGVVKSRSFTVYLDTSAPPSSGNTGSGRSTATDTTFNSFNSTTHAAVSDELSVVVGASGNVTLSAPLYLSTDAVSPSGTFSAYGIWRWWNGAAWVDVGTEVVSSISCVVDSRHRVFPGRLSVPQTKTGLTPAATEKFQLYARNASGTRTMYLSGTASAVS